MKFKKEYIVLLLVIIGLSLYLAMRSRDRTHFELPQVATVDSKTIDRIVLKKGDSTIELIKKDDSWFVGPKAYPADGTKARNLVNAAADLKISALVSESGNYDRYDLSDDKKVNVRAFAGSDERRNFDVGRGAPTNQHSFVRLGQDPRVYHARGRIHDTFDVTVDELRDETVLAFEKDDIVSVHIEKGAQQVTLVKIETPAGQNPDNPQPAQADTQAQWQDSQGNTVDQSAVTRLLGDFALLKCSDYMQDDARPALKDALWTVEFKTADKTHRVSVFAMQSDDALEYPAVSSYSEYAFFLTKSKVENDQKQLDKLLEPEKKS